MQDKPVCPRLRSGSKQPSQQAQIRDNTVLLSIQTQGAVTGFPTSPRTARHAANTKTCRNPHDLCLPLASSAWCSPLLNEEQVGQGHPKHSVPLNNPGETDLPCQTGQTG